MLPDEHRQNLSTLLEGTRDRPVPDAEGASLQQRRAWAERLQEETIEYIKGDSFDDPDKAEEILRPVGELNGGGSSGTGRESQPKPPPETPPYLADLYAIPLLSHEEEFHLFRKMNYLKYRADVLRWQLDPDRPQAEEIEQIEACLEEALAIRNHIAGANLRLVVSIAKHLVDSANSLEDLISDGNMPLLRAVEIFDFTRGTRFSTYATWAIRNMLRRAGPRNRRRRQRFLTGSEPVFEWAADDRSSLRACEARHRRMQSAVAEMLDQLDSRDQRIVMSRFGLNESGRLYRFREIGEQLGISTERARQLCMRSLRRLREVAEAKQIDFP